MKALLVLLLLAGTAAADKEAALRYFRAGEKAYGAQNFLAAAQNFDEAYQELPAPEIAFSAAQAYRRQYRVDGKPEYARRAVELYRIYLDKVKTGGRVGDAADSLGEMLRELDRLGIDMRGGKAAPVERTRLGVTVSVGSEPSEAVHEIEDKVGQPAIAVATTIDGKRVDPDTMVDVEPGEHVVRAEAAGFQPAEKKERAVPGHSGLVELALVPLPARVAIATDHDADVRIDGRRVQLVPGRSLDIEAGHHLLAITRRGHEPITRELVLTRGQTLALDEPLVPTAQRRAVRYVALGAGVLGIATAVVGIVALVEDRRAADKLDQLHAGDQSPSLGAAYADARDQRDRYRTMTLVGGGLTLAAALAAGALYYFDTPSEDGFHVTASYTGTVTGGHTLTIGGMLGF